MKADPQTSMTPGADAPRRLLYATPSVHINALRLITLGGSTGGGDSGSTGTEEPGGGIWSDDDHDTRSRESDEWVG